MQTSPFEDGSHRLLPWHGGAGRIWPLSGPPPCAVLPPFSLTVRCPVTRPSMEEMMRSTHSCRKQAQESFWHARFRWSSVNVCRQNECVRCSAGIQLDGQILVTRPSVEETTRSTDSGPMQAQESIFHAVFVDLGTAVVDEVRTGTYRKLVDPR